MTALESSQPDKLLDDMKYIMLHTSSFWGELRGENIFITGGTGFIGCWLLESFIWANKQMALNATAYILTRNHEAFYKKAPHLACNSCIKIIEGDILTCEFPSEFFSFIIHAATETDHNLYDEYPLLAFDVITAGTRRILELSRKAGTKKILFVSSGAVYGKQSNCVTRMAEDYQGEINLYSAKSVYSEGKRAAELLCGIYARQYNINISVARCFTFIGPYMSIDKHFAIGNFIRDALSCGPITVSGDGTAYRSYMYAADLAIWLWTVLFRGKTCRPYNVGSDKEMQISDVAHTVAAEAPGKIGVVIKKTPDAMRPEDRYVPDINRARLELGLSFGIPFPEAIRRTLRWFSESTASSPMQANRF